ncbi:thioester-containing protein 1 allele R1-like [Aedes albopictus]|uniref:Alpha-macroglobulin receptor-binding domain-containing protein n=1 Tax=Aedes albopictus TaxID=7160 RepID=A0ABM2A6U9_AEDAL
MIEANYTFGRPVRGTIIVQLCTDDDSHVVTHSDRRRFDGKDVFLFKLKEELDADYDNGYAMVRANVSLTDEFFDSTSNVSKEIPVFINPYKITIIRGEKYYRPGVAYNCELSVEDHYGYSVRNKIITVRTDDSKYKIKEVAAKLNDQGIATLELPMPDEFDSVAISVVFENREYRDIRIIDGYAPASTQYLQISMHERNVKDSTVSFIVRSNEKFSHLYYFVTSRGNILLAKHERFPNTVNHTINFKLTVAMTMQSKLVVYTLNSGDWISEDFDLDYFTNEVSYALEEHTVQPNQYIEIAVTAAEDSYVAFQAIDQGVLLLGYEGFGLTKEHVLKDLDEYTTGGIYSDMSYFDSFGLFMRTDFKIHDQSSRTKRSTHQTRRQPRVKPTSFAIGYAESWLWKNYTMNNQKMLTISDVVPKTLTSWLVSGFALSPTRGLGLIKAPVKLTVSKPFYIISNLPYSIKRFEVVRIQTTLFNFLTDLLPTNVTLYNLCGEFEFVDRTSYDGILGKQAIVVPYGQPTSASFLIKAKKLGDITVKIKAESTLRTDKLKHKLRVTPESLLHLNSETVFIDLESHGTQNFNMRINIPKRADRGSVNIQAIIDPVSASFMTTIAQNLSHLFAIPTGTASSSLQAIIPNVVLLDCIKETNLKDPLVEQGAVNYLSTGYINLLKYRHSNGAFGQWDPPQKKSSIFLTALVANAFATAANHIEIDKTIVTKAFSWIKEKQKQNGCFEEVGEIIYEPMQDSSSSFALTAFVVAAIQENNVTAIQFGELMEKATNCLAENFHSLTNAYDIALATYALSLTGHAKRQDYLHKLIGKFHEARTGRSWAEDLKVEITGYVLLSLLAQNMHQKAIPIMEWLNAQRYATAAFSGIPSSFVTLKALGKIAVYLHKRETNYTVHIRSNVMHRVLTVDNSNSQSLIAIDFPNNTHTLEFEIEGIGFGFLQVDYTYKLGIQRKRASFHLDVIVMDTSTYKIQNLQVCLSYAPMYPNETSGVVLVEVYLADGFVVYENALKDHYRHIIKTERVFNNTALFVYYDEVSTEQECFEVTAHRKYQTALHRPSYVVVYDTNDLDKHAITSYEDVAREG